MANLWKQGVLGGLALVAGLGLQGCTDEETGLYIDGVLLFTAPQCIVRNDPGSTFLLDGTLDVQERGQGYDASLLVANQFTPRGDKQNLRNESMVVTITGAVVRLSDAVGATVAEFSVPASGVIQPESGTEPGFGIVNVTLIPGSEVQKFLNGENDELPEGDRNRRVTRIARVSVFGRTIGGLDVQSSEYSYVISLCRGCLDCDPSGMAGLVDTSCHPGQDGVICESPDR